MVRSVRGKARDQWGVILFQPPELVAHDRPGGSDFVGDLGSIFWAGVERFDDGLSRRTCSKTRDGVPVDLVLNTHTRITTPLIIRLR